jgi:dimethylhistidine N-methyltransferase
MQDECSCREIVDGLVAAQAVVSPKYLYDDLGSRLFELITHLPEYYPTRVEAAVLERHAGAIREAAGTETVLIDLGAGNCRKARALFPVLKPQQYVAVDISADFLGQALASMRTAFGNIEMYAIAADLSSSFALPAAVRDRRRVFFYPGSSIGNMDPDEALELLRRIRVQCGSNGGLLIGIDLVKDAPTLYAAYNDALGLTAAFNLNVLNHLNALLHSDFRLSDWRHRAFFDDRRERIEMHLDARRDLAVAWPGGQRRFRTGESIHTENSYKYRLPDFKAMMAQAGFRQVCAWSDERRWFAVCYGEA